MPIFPFPPSNSGVPHWPEPQRLMDLRPARLEEHNAARGAAGKSEMEKCSSGLILTRCFLRDRTQTHAGLSDPQLYIGGVVTPRPSRYSRRTFQNKSSYSRRGLMKPSCRNCGSALVGSTVQSVIYVNDQRSCIRFLSLFYLICL